MLAQAGRQEKVDAAFLVDLAMLYFLEDTPKSNQTNILVSPRAKDALDRAMKLSPTNVVVMQKLAQGLRLAGEAKSSSEVYARLIKEYPRLPGLREELTELLFTSSNQGRGGAARAAHSGQPHKPASLLLSGRDRLRRHRYTEAVEHYRKALLLNPENEQVYYDIAAAKVALNEPNEALEYIKQAETRFKPSFVGQFSPAWPSCG